MVSLSTPSCLIAEQHLHQEPIRQIQEFTPIPLTPEYIANNRKKRPDYVFSPKTFKALTQSPPNPIKRFRINFSTLSSAPITGKKEFARNQSARIHKNPARTEDWLALFADSTKNQLRKDKVLQLNHCTTTVFDDADFSNVDRNDEFFTEDSLKF
jgi:hypothetical protein